MHLESDIDRENFFDSLFRRRFDGVVIYFFDSEFKFFDESSAFSVTSLHVVLFSSKFTSAFLIGTRASLIINRFVAIIFTALHGMQTPSSAEISVCLFVRLSVCLSVKRVDCDKTEEKSVQIFIPYKRSFKGAEKRKTTNFGTKSHFA